MFPTYKMLLEIYEKELNAQQKNRQIYEQVGHRKSSASIIIIEKNDTKLSFFKTCQSDE